MRNANETNPARQLLVETIRLLDLALMSRLDVQQRYDKWWLGQWCRRAYSQGPFRLVTKVELIGPPSFVYGSVRLHYDDGTGEIVSAPSGAFRPRKSDVEVRLP